MVMKTEFIKSASIFFLILFFSSISHPAYARESSNQKNIWLVSIISKIENNIKHASDDVKRYEKEIAKCETAIANSEKIINLAREKNKPDVEKVAKDASDKANTNMLKYSRLLNKARYRLIQSQVNLDSIKRTLNDYSKLSPSVSAVATNYSGHVSIQKANGEKIDLDGSHSAFLEKGDVISTSDNSKVELEFLEGRGNVVVGENSQLKMEQNKDSSDVMNAIRGKMKLKVTKLAGFDQEMQKEYEKYKQDTSSIHLSYEQFIYYLKAKLKKKFEVRTPSAVTSVRGTEFLVYSNEDKSTGIIVLEGSVELKSVNGSDKMMINAGQKGTVNEKGVQSKPIQVDISTLEKWWEDE